VEAQEGDHEEAEGRAEEAGMNWMILNVSLMLAPRLAVFRAQGQVRQGQISGDLRRAVAERVWYEMIRAVRRPFADAMAEMAKKARVG